MKAIVYAAVALVAGAAGFAIYRVAIEPKIAPASETLSSGAVAAAPEAAQETPAPDVLPEFTLMNVAGEPTSIRSWPGKSMVVNFWATWCAPCRREIPFLKQLQTENAAKGFQIVGVAVDVREDVLKYAKEVAIDYPLIMGEQEGLEAVGKFGLGSIGFPFTVFTDNQHRIIVTHLGELHPEQATVIMAAVTKVNAGELSPTQARGLVTKQLEELDTHGA